MESKTKMRTGEQYSIDVKELLELGIDNAIDLGYRFSLKEDASEVANEDD